MLLIWQHILPLATHISRLADRQDRADLGKQFWAGSGTVRSREPKLSFPSIGKLFLLRERQKTRMK